MNELIQKIEDDLLLENKINLYLFRDDLNGPIKGNPHVTGNKWRKLKYNIQEAKKIKSTTLLTFGGAFSNHIHATAAAGKAFGLKTIGLIRGEEHLPLNPTLQFAIENDMHIQYLDRTTYKKKSEDDFINQLKIKFPNAYILPEGGTNSLAIKGSQEITNDISIPYDCICCPCGTGGTLTGVIASSNPTTNILGFSALKGNFLAGEIQQLLIKNQLNKSNKWSINSDYHFGGYAKIKPPLIHFIKNFKEKHNIQLDPVYTGKMMFGIFDLIEKKYFKEHTNIVAIHTGGQQGIAGFKKHFI